MGGMGGMGGMEGMGGPPKPKAKAVKKTDLKYVKCPACNSAAKFFHGKAIIERATRGSSLTEDHLVKIAQDICDEKSSIGPEFLEAFRFRPTKEGQVVLATRVKGESGCGDDCALLTKACEMSWGEVDLDAAEMLYRGESDAQAVATEVCADACSPAPPALPDTHWLFKRATKERKRREKKSKKTKSASAAKEEL
jgi:hypothetical protein